MRIYLVKNGEKVWMVRAANKNQAIRHVTDKQFTCDVATQDDILEHAGAVPVEDASPAESAA